MYPMMTSFDPTGKAVGSPNRTVWYIEEARFAASGGGGSSRASGSDGSGGGGGGCVELGGVSCQRHNHGAIGTTLAFWDSACPSNLVAHAPLHAQNLTVNFDRAVVLNDVDLLSSFFMSWRNDHDPFDFGVGSVADGTFGGRKPNFEQLLLFRSHRLMQVEAVSIAIGMPYSSSASERQRFNLIASTVTNKARAKVAERTNSTVERIRALAKNGMLNLHNKQKEVIDEERKNCHRIIAAILDSATGALKEMSISGCSVGSGSDCSGGGDYGSTSGFGSTSENNCFSAAAIEPWLASEPGNNRPAFLPSTLEPSPFSESRQLATNPAWEGFANTSCVAMAHLPIPPIVTPGPPQQQPIMSLPGSMVGRSSGSARIKMHDCLSVPRIFEEAPLSYKQHNTVIAYTPLPPNKKSPMVTKMGAKTLVGSRSAHSNRKGSRHRMTPQAKEILEDWVAKHGLNPYPTGEEKICLAQACKMTVSQVNNWMVNVRVRRRRAKKIGMATGPKHITFAGFLPKAVEANMPQGMAAAEAEAEDLLAGETALKGTKEESSMTIVGGSNWKPLERSWVSPWTGKRMGSESVFFTG